jgi:hypothetical protein
LGIEAGFLKNTYLALFEQIKTFKKYDYYC